MRRSRIALAAGVSAVTVLASVGAAVGTGGAAAASAGRPGTVAGRVALPGSYAPPTGARALGRHTSARMTVELALAPGHAAELSRTLAALYAPTSPRYHRWLGRGAFDRLFRPGAATALAARAFLTSAGLRLVPASSPFLLRAVGSAAQVERTFGTALENYRTAAGRPFWANTAPVRVPRALARSVQGVLGLTDVSRLHSMAIPAPRVGHGRAAYGAGPHGSGLTPSQTASLYDAGKLFAKGPRGQGVGVRVALFELSRYRLSDIGIWAKHFYGRRYHPPIDNIMVDGGPGPHWDGDVEVVADIEQVLALSRHVQQIRVYNAPNTTVGALDEYTTIANQDVASVISSSWGECEQDAGMSTLESENTVFEQMAMQGQSMFAAAGDTGAYGCLRDTGSPNLDDFAVGDPASQPYVTGVGGSSFEAYNPGRNPHPNYPRHGESVWDRFNGCAHGPNTSCTSDGAGNGGVSLFWGRPSYQQGQGVVSQFSTRAPSCQLAATGYCREVPDVSADADEYTGYAEYCTGSDVTDSECWYIDSDFGPWFEIGGTSLASPLWAGVIADIDSYHHGRRYGEASYSFYRFLRARGYARGKFHDVSGKGFIEKTNGDGRYPTTLKYDMATGIGTPDISRLAGL